MEDMPAMQKWHDLNGVTNVFHVGIRLFPLK